MGSYWLIETEFVWNDEKILEQWWWLYNIVTVINAIVYIKMAKMVNFVIYFPSKNIF